MQVSGWLRRWIEGVWRRKTEKLRDRSNRRTAAGLEYLEPRVMLTAPYSSDDSYDVDTYAGATIDAASGVLANDMDFDGDPLTASVVSPPNAGGSLNLNGDGSFNYFPFPGYTGTETFTYQAWDGTEYGNTATVTFNVTDQGEGGGSNSAPNAVADSYTATSGTVLSVNVGSGVLNNDNDPDGDTLTAQVQSGPANGTLTLSGDGSFTYDPQSFTGTTSFTYTAFDGSLSSNTATVNITVNSGGGGSALTAIDDTLFVEADSSSAELQVLLNDDNPNGGTLSVSAAGTPTNGSSSYGFGSSASDEVVFYTPNTGFNGSDAFTYDATNGTETDTGNLSLTVHSVDNTLAQARTLSPVGGTELVTGGIIGDGPQSWSDVDLFAVALGAGDVLDIDVDAAALDTGGTLGSLDALLRLFDATGTELASNASGIDPDTSQSGSDPFLSYTAATAGTYYIGLSDSYNSTYDPTYSGGGSSYSYGAYELQINLTASNAAPTTVDDSATTHHGTTLQIDVLANDSDADGDTLTISSVADPANGTATIVTTGNGPQIEYSPDAGFSGTETVDYTVSDPGGLTSTATITVSVTNTAPTAVNGEWDAVKETPLSIAAPGVLTDAADADGDTLTAALDSGPSNGTLTLNADGSFDYTPGTSFTGTDSFTFKATDGAGDSAAMTVTLTVYAAASVAFDDTWSVGHDTTLSISADGVLENDWDFEGDTLSVVPGSQVGPSNGVLTLNADGSFDYTPNPGFVGTDSFTYQATDGVHTTNSATVTIEVTNFAPIASGDYYLVSHDRTLTAPVGDLFGNDLDIEGSALTAEEMSSTTNGVLTLLADGSFTYVPDLNFTGTDTFSYRVSDGIHDSNTVDVTIDVTNAVPDGGDDQVFTQAGTDLIIAVADLLANDFDADDDAMTFALSVTAANGTLTDQNDGTWLYSPNAGFSGFDSFTYTLNDGLVTSSDITVTVKVANSAPFAVSDFYTVAHNRTLSATVDGVLANDIDDDADPLTVALETGPANGTLTLNVDGTFDYTPNTDFTGDDSFTYRTTDGYATTEPATVSISVVNHDPIARTDSYSVHQGQLLSVDVADGLLTNDSDSDTDTLTAQYVVEPTDGTLTLSADGSFDYQPDAGFSGSDSFTYEVSDGLATSTVVEVTINVDNSAPITTADSYSVVHDQLLTVSTIEGVLSNDLDLDDDTLTVAIVTNPASGTLVPNSDGSFTYTPNTGFAGVDTFEYSVTDGAATISPITVTIDVVNHVPSAASRSFAVLHDTTFNVAAPGLFAFSGDAESDVLTLTDVSTPANGSLTTNADGSFTYIPNAGFVGEDTFSYRTNDGIASSDLATVTLTVFNSAPLAVDDYYSISHDRPLNVSVSAGVLSNDSDLNDDSLAVSVVSGQGPTYGTVTLNADGSFDYTPTADFTGEDSFEYEVTDGAETATAQVTIFVLNSAPVAAPEVYGVIPDTQLSVTSAEGVLANDTDADSDALTAELVDLPDDGTVTLYSDGSFTYTPDTGFVGVDQFTYRAKDDLDTESSLTVVQVTTALVASDDQIEVIHDRVATGNVFDNDYDAFGTPVTVVQDDAISGGTLTLQPSGDYTFTPDTGFTGTVTFTYHLDNGTVTSNVATVTFDVVNHVPQAFHGVWRTAHGQTLNVAADRGLDYRSYDRDDDALMFQILQYPTHGTLTVNADGSFDYVPTDASYTGPDSFDWMVSDSVSTSEQQTAWIEITNFLPNLSDDELSVHSGTTLTLTAADGVLSNDSDVDDDPLTASVVTGPTHGTLTLNADGLLTYVPNATVINETDSFTYLANDGASNSEPATVTIDIHNAVPVVYGETFAVLHDQDLNVDATGGLLVNDYDSDGDTLTVVSDGLPSHGTLTLNADGSFDYTANADYVGTDSFTYKVFDGFEYTDALTVTLDVTNTVPVALDDLQVTRRGQSVTFAVTDLTDNDSDADSDTFSFLTPSNPTNGTLTDNGDGTWTYAPNAGFVGEDTFTYRINDGVADSADATVTIEVLNAAPNAANDIVEVPHDQTLNVAAGVLQTNDSDLEGDALTVAIGQTTEHGLLTLNSDGSFTYTPDADFAGRDSFTYTLSDGDLVSDPARVILEVINTRPVGRDSWQRLTHDTTLTVDQSSGLIDSASDGEDDPLNVTVVSDVNNGTLNVQNDGSWTYIPAAGFVGTDSFTYRVNDGALDSTTSTVLLDVANTPVVASLDVYTTVPDTALSIAAPGILQNDSDIDGDQLTLTVIDDLRHGTLALAQDGSFTYTPDTGYIGSDAFTYRVSDGIDSAIATVQFTVTGINSSPDPLPVARNDFHTINHSQVLEAEGFASVLTNDSDPENDAITAQLVAGPSSGTLTFNTDGTFTYTPDPGNATTAPFTGVDSFTYQASDGTNLSTVATVEITVANTLPWAASTAFAVHQGDSISTEVGLLSRFAGDRDGDDLTFTKVSDPASGTLTFNTDGTFTYTPNTGFTGSDFFTFSVADAVGSSQTATVDIDVTNERPTALDLDFRTQHGTPFSETGRGVLSAAADRDGDDLTAVLVTGPADGTLTLNSDGTFDYTPDAAFSGSDEFRFKVFDGAEYSYESVVTLSVDNQTPTALPSSATTKHGTEVALQITAFDPDGDTITYELVTSPQHGSLVYDNLINDGSNNEPITFTGGVSWQPDAGYVGDDSFDYRVTDGVSEADGLIYSETATVRLSSTNFVPQTSDGFQSTVPEQDVVVAGTGLFASASDGDADTLTLEIVTQPASGTVTLTTDANSNITGGYTYAPNTGFAGEDSFTWRVHDGAEWSDPATVTIDVANNAPVISDRSFRSPYNQGTAVAGGGRSYEFDLAEAAIAADPDGQTLTYSIVDPPEHGTAVITAAGELTYASTSSTFTGLDTVTVEVSDGYATSDVSTISIDVTNTTPVASSDFRNVSHSDTFEFTAEDLLSNDFDFDGDTLTVVSVTAGTDGTLTESNGTYTFDPGTFVGTTELTYTVTDGVDTSELAKVHVTVAANNLPVGSNRSFQVTAGGTVPVASAASFWDADDDAVSLEVVTAPTLGTFSQISGIWVYDSAAGGSGTGQDTVTYRLNDGHGVSQDYTYTFTVQPNLSAGVQPSVNPDLNYEVPVNVAPFVEPELVSLSPGDTHSGNLLDAATDVNGDTMRVSSFNGTPIAAGATETISLTSGTMTVSSDGTYTFVANGTKATDSLEFEVADQEETAAAVFILDVDNIEPVVGKSPYLGTNDSTAASGNLLDSAKDLDGDALTVESVTVAGVTHTVVAGGTTATLPTGNLSVQTNGSYTFTPNGSAIGSESFQFTVSDGFDQTVSDASVLTYRTVTPSAPDGNPNNDSFDFVSDGVVGNVLDNDIIPVGATVTASIVGSSDGAFGSVSLDAAGNLNYTLAADTQSEFLVAGGETKSFEYTASWSLTVNSTTTTGVVNGKASVAATILLPGEVLSKDGVTASNNLQASNWDGTSVDSEPVYVVIAGGGAAFSPVVPGGSYGVSANGSTGSPAGAGWDGDAAFIDISADGDIGFGAGELGTVNAHAAGGDISEIEAENVNAEAGGSLAKITAGNVHYARGAQGVADVTADGNIDVVHAGYGDPATIGRVQAGANIGDVFATGGTGRVIAKTGAIGMVMGTQGVGGDKIKAKASIGYYQGLGAYVDFTGLSEYTTAVRGIVGGSVGTLEQISAEGPISFVHSTTWDIANEFLKITSNSTIEVIKSSRDIDVDLIYAKGNLPTVRATGGIDAEITAGQNIGNVIAESGSILGDFIVAGNDIELIDAGGTLTNFVIAGNGSIGNVRAENISNFFILAKDSVHSVTTQVGTNGGQIQTYAIGGLTGFVGNVTAAGSISATVFAPNSVGTVEGTSFTGAVFTNGSIESVTATTDNIAAAITAGTSIGTVSAFVSINGSVNAGESIESVVATEGVINAPVTAGQNIGTVSAGTNLLTSVKATNGGIGTVEAGTHHIGGIYSDITAKTEIKKVSSQGQVIGNPSVKEPDPAAIAAALATNPGAPLPKPLLNFTSWGGFIWGDITADNYIGTVEAEGEITGRVESSLGSVVMVSALGDIDGEIKSEIGLTTVDSMGAIKQNITAKGGANVFAYGDNLGKVKSENGKVTLRTWGSHLNDAMGKYAAHVTAWDGVSATEISSSSGPVSVVSAGSIRARLDAAKDVAAFAHKELDVSSGLKSQNGKAFASSFNNMNAQIDAHDEVFVSTGGELKGDIITAIGGVNVIALAVGAGIDAPEGIYIISQEDVTGRRLHSSDGSIFVEASSITAGTIHAPNGGVMVTTFGDFSSRTTAKHDILATVYGSAGGATLESKEGGVYLTTTEGGEVTADAQSDGKVSVVSWADLSGHAKSAAGSTAVFVYGDLNSEISAGKTATVFAWGDTTKEISGTTGATVFAENNITAKVSSTGGNVSITAGGNVDAETKANAGKVRINALGDVTQKAEAQTGISIDAFSATSDVISDYGPVTVVLLNKFTGKAETDGDISISAGDIIKPSAKIDAGGKITLKAVKAIQDAELEADGAVHVSSADKVSSVNIVKSDSIGISGLAGVETLTAQSANKIIVYSGADISGTARSAAGKVDVVAVGDVSGDYESASGNVSVTSFGTAGLTTAKSTTGTATVFGYQAVSGTITGGTYAAGVSLGTFDSTINATNVTVYAAETVTANTSSATTVNVDITGGGMVSGTVYATATASVMSMGAMGNGVSLSASSSGGVSANISAPKEVTVSALGGDFTGSATAYSGDVTVFAGDNSSGGVIAGDTARVRAIGKAGDQQGNITGNNIVHVTAFGEVEGTITGGAGGATIYSGKDVKGTITAGGDISVTSVTGQVTADVTSNGASAGVSALATVSGNVTAHRHAGVFSLGDITGQLTTTTGSVSAVTWGGKVDGNISAAEHALVMGFNLVSAPIVAGKHVLAYSGMFIDATITSTGGSVAASSLGEIKGMITADESVFISSFGKADLGSVDAVNGSLLVSSPHGVTAGTLNAGESIAVISGDNITLGMTAADEDIFVMSMGQTNTLFATATENLYVWAAGEISGALEGTNGDVMAVSLGVFGAPVIAGDDAFVYALDWYNARLEADGNAVVITMGPAAGLVDADESALVFALGAATALNVDAGENAALVTWGGATTVTVTGPESAYAWANTGFDGSVTSANGPAALIVMGTSGAPVTAGTDAFVMSTDDYFGTLSAGESALVITMGNLIGGVTAGEDLLVLSEADVLGPVTATTGDAGVFAHGSIRNTVSAGTDAWAYTFEEFTGSVMAGQDVLFVYAVGKIDGLISAQANIGGPPFTQYGLFDVIFSHDNILADILAGPLPSSTDTSVGNISSVGSWGPIGGYIKATNSIGPVRSAATIPATLDAPNVAGKTENDPNLVASTPSPTLPPSVRADVLADVAAALLDLNSAKSDIGDDRDDARNDFVTSRTDATNAIAQFRYGVQHAVADGAAEAPIALADQVAKVSAASLRRRRQRDLDIKDLRQQVSDVRLELVADDVAAAARAQTAVTQMHQLRTQIDISLTTVGNELQNDRQNIVDGADARDQRRRSSWDDYILQQKQQILVTMGQSFGENVPDEPWGWAVFTAGAWGLVDGGRAVFNGLVDAGWFVATLGFGDDLHVLGKGGRGYGTAHGFAKFGWSLLFSVAVGPAAAAQYARGRVVTATAILGWDLAANTSGLGRGIYSISQEGVTLGNLLETVGGALGILGNISGFKNGLKSALGDLDDALGGAKPCFVAGTPVEISVPAHVAAMVPSGEHQRKESSAETVQLPIESVRLGSRVPAKNPNRHEYDFSLPRVQPESWRQIDLNVIRSDGSMVRMELLRPLTWIQNLDLYVGKRFPLRLQDVCEGTGRATVLDISPCPPIDSADGSIITGTFGSKLADDLYDLVLEDGTKITGTGCHPVWDVQKREWKPIAHLRPGDFLDSNGTPLCVSSIAPLSNREDVFNIEVHGEHVYRVSHSCVLAHNKSNPTDPADVFFDAQKKTVVLGLDKHLDDFAAAHNGRKVLQLAEDPLNWKQDFFKLINDPDAEILFHLKEVDVWPGITRASSGRGFGATDWELLQIYQNKEWWSRIKWIDELGNEVPNPFL